MLTWLNVRSEEVPWRCPRAQLTAAELAKPRRAQGVTMAEREARETIHLIPGFSDAISRAVPDARPVMSGDHTWERRWPDPADPNIPKVVQVRLLSQCDSQCDSHLPAVNTFFPSALPRCCALPLGSPALVFALAPTTYYTTPQSRSS